MATDSNQSVTASANLKPLRRESNRDDPTLDSPRETRAPCGPPPHPSSPSTTSNKPSPRPGEPIASSKECLVTCGLTRRTLLRIVGVILCFSKLSTDIFLYRLALSDPTLVASRLAAVQKDLFGAGLLLAQGTHETATVVHGQYNSSAFEASSSNSSQYAYAFVIGGVNPIRPAYKGFLYNILVSARILRQLGSNADVVAFFQLSIDYKGSDTLPDEDLSALHKMGIIIYYIEPSEHESFYETVMNKFRILQLTQYRRVLLMDGDVMPVSNLDYLFQLSDDNKHGPGNSTLRENVIVAGPWEPSNAGFFMLTPAPGEYELIEDIMRKRHEQAEADGVLFDEVKGWGHVIEEGDEWVSRRESGRNWTFHFAFSDQGLLYHWTKYVKQSVTIVYEDKAENWSPMVVNGETKAVKERVLDAPFLNYSNPLVIQYGSCKKFMCDFIHFSGSGKPWLARPLIDNLTDRNKLEKGEHIWWYFLMVVDHELGLHLDFHNWRTGQIPTHGLFATWADMGKHKNKLSALTEAADVKS